MSECNALGIVGRDDAGPQNPKVRARKIKVPSSSDEEEEASESAAGSAEGPEVESAGSTEDSDGDDDGDDDESGGSDTDTDAHDEDEETEEKGSSPHPSGGPAVVSSPATSLWAPPTVEEESGPVGMEVDDDAFVVAPQRKGRFKSQSLALEPSFATGAMPASPHGSSAGSVGMPESLGHKRPHG